MDKPYNNKAWFLVIPVFLLVALSAIIPIMTVINYSFQDTFGNNQFFWAGTEWFQDVLHSDRFWNALGRNLVFSMIILSIEIPLGIAIALTMPKKGIWVPVCLVLMALPLLIPWNVVGTIWQIFGRADIGLLGHTIEQLGFEYNYASNVFDAWVTIILMDVWHWTSPGGAVVLRRTGVDPRSLLPGGEDRRGVAVVGFPVHPAAEDPRRADHRLPAAVHGFLHDLHRALRADRRRAGQLDHIHVDRPCQAGHRPVRPGPAAAMSLVYQLIVLTICYVFFTVMSNVGVDKPDARVED
jgi:glycerol transport system permease protein